MLKQIFKVRQTIIGFFDILLTILAYFSAYYIRDQFFYEDYGHLQPINKYIWLLWLIIPLFPALFNFFDIYKLKRNVLNMLIRTALAVLIGIMFIVGTFYFMGDNSFSRLFYGIFGVIEFTFVYGLRIALKIFLRYKRKTKRNFRRIVVVGHSHLADKFYEYIKENEDLSIEIIGNIQVEEGKKYRFGKVLGRIENLVDIVKENQVDEVVFALPKDYLGRIEEYVLQCEEMGITVSMLLDLYDLKVSKTNVSKIGDFPILSFYTVALSDVQLFLKRILDIIGSIVGLIITGIVFIFVGPAIWLEDKGPIFFSQDRVGRNGRIFKCYKFRSMYTDAEEKKKELMKYNEMKGHMFKMKDDPRITKIGKFIRKTSIDELPQFWNVLKGDMSLVGTRPPTVSEVKEYENYHRRRISIKPGITGMWQVSGRNEIEDFEEVVKLDTWYIDNWSIWLDIKLLLKTVWVVFAKKGSR